jgi:hypothetical protein
MLPSNLSIEIRHELADSDAQHKNLNFRHLPIAAKLLTKDEARRIAANVATRPRLR